MNVLHILGMDAFLRLAVDPNAVAKDIGDAFMWKVTEKGYMYWYEQWAVNRITPGGVTRIKEMKNIFDRCNFRVDTVVGLSDEAIDAYTFAEELDGLFFATNEAFFFSEIDSAVAFKLRFG